MAIPKPKILDIKTGTCWSKSKPQRSIQATSRMLGALSAISEMDSPTIKDMGSVVKNVMARFAAAGSRVDGKQVSEIAKRQLSG